MKDHFYLIGIRLKDSMLIFLSIKLKFVMDIFKKKFARFT